MRTAAILLDAAITAAETRATLLALIAEAGESRIDVLNTRAAEDKIDRLQRAMDREQELIDRLKNRQRRSQWLEKLRKKNAATPTKTDEAKATPAKPSYADRVIRDERGKVIAYRVRHGGQDVFLTAGGKLIGREVDGRTFDATSRFRGHGRQGLRLVGTSQNRSKPPRKGLQE